jgi:hypothetical protein
VQFIVAVGIVEVDDDVGAAAMVITPFVVTPGIDALTVYVPADA